LELEEYQSRTETLPSGYLRVVEGRDINELPLEKQLKVRQLLRERFGEEEPLEVDEGDQDNEDKGGPVAERTAYRTRGQTSFEIFEDKKKKAQREFGTVKACYFMYKYRRNS
jgi:hypothetical protein